MSGPKPSIFSSLFLALFFVSFKLSNCINCHEIEKQSLLSFKQSINGSSDVLSSWDTKYDCCTWKGVVCSNLTGRVLQLHLQGNYLGGKISSSLPNLKRLKYLDLSQNNFEEEIPFFVGSLASLEYLNLSFAGFYGKIPHNIGNLSNLNTLSLGSSEQLLNADILEWLSGLRKLEHLNMNGVNLSKATNWAQQVINNLPSLVELQLNHCNLNFMATLNDVNNISRSNLDALDLSYNSLSYAIIPSWIFQLRNLTYLDMSSNLFEGPIPSMSNTTKLQHIDISNNNLNSSIPQWLYSSKHLEYVSLANNLLRDGISNSIANLTSLSNLNLRGNKLSGKIPREIANLCNMHVLRLSYNKLGGEISDSFGNMSDCFLGALESLTLFENQLSGHLPPQFGKFTRLRSLNLGKNSLSGVIPDELGNLLSLERLYLDNNKLTGNLPESIGKLVNFTELWIENNTLEGVVTETHFANLSNLKVLHASGNHLTLKVDPDWIPPFKLETLSLGSWDLGSRIPLWLETQKESISSLDLSCSGINGNVPSWLWSLRLLNLSHNQLDGKILSISDRGHDYDFLHFFDLSSNRFSGPLPQLMTSSFLEIHLSNNSFSGGLSDFFCISPMMNSSNVVLINFGRNRLSGELPECFIKWQSLQVLNLANNQLSGRIPDSMGFLKHLVSLNLHGNNFSGHIPSSLQNCTEIMKIDFADNNLGGCIPKWIDTRFFNLRFLILQSNNLRGEISPSICQLTSLQILDLSNNKLTGRLPQCLNNLTTMTTKRMLDRPQYSLSIESLNRLGSVTYGIQIHESASIAIKGRELTYDANLFLVISIDLSNNILSGDIPREITSLVELRTLNLSRNNLTGSIPDNIGNMRQLESLDVSMNSLSGNIPGSMSIMTSLNYLNMSYNHLTGRIPQSTQIGSFNESSFMDNNLCGFPLWISCKNDSNVPAPTQVQIQGRQADKPKINWFYAFLSLGYAVGLSTVLSALFFKRNWREVYYAFFQKLWDSVYLYFVIRWRKLLRVLGRNP
ncbi:disease resistance family protein / LRR family protein [Striga hermonthica]|uniref:Disease resistance family protein / LRR family protein n=1 Tax=Striga hermonthica TaxID=68872 RepID=A0A9N7N9V8_STRHE|nr:disease resistance family protein / LRR family protein [Striga hermonthica]